MTDRWPGLKFALFAAVCLVAAAVVVNWTGNFNRIPLLQPATTYEALLDDASGLAIGDDVRVSGVRVGRVTGVGVERGLALVTFELDPMVNLTDRWEVGARWRNVIGQRYLYLYDAEGGRTLEPGSRIPVERSRRTADLGRFFREITPLLQAIPPEDQNRLLHAFNEALDGNTQRVQELVRDLGSLAGTLADQEPEIRTVLVQGSELLETYQERQEELRAFIADLADVGGTLGARNDELLAAVTDIGEVQRQFGDLLRANEDEIRGIVDDLDTITDHIGVQREEGTLEEAIHTAPAGMATYMLISRHGQWFDVRAVAVQVQQNGEVLFCQTERGEPCSDPNSSGAGRGPNSSGAGRGPNSSGAATSAASRAPARLDALEVTTRGALGAVPATGLWRAALHDEGGG